MCKISLNCEECGRDFQSASGLHRHIPTHGIDISNYYCKHFPRKNKFTNKLLPYGTLKDYFRNDFETRLQFTKWCESIELEDDYKYVVAKVRERVVEKGLSYAPFSFELEHSFLPSLESIKTSFGSYSSLCERLEIEPLFDKNLPHDFWDRLPTDLEIITDTRERKPLRFKGYGQDRLALDIGDYTLKGKYFNNTFVDRKSSGDFASTLSSHSGNLERFERELQRTCDSGCYLFIVIESNFIKMVQESKYTKIKVNTSYLAHTVKHLSHKYARRCQFIFADDRTKAADLILRLLYFGPQVQRTDIQYFLCGK